MSYSSIKRDILINVTPYQKRIAILENHFLKEIFYDQAADTVLVGSIYKGKVQAVLPSLNAAFVEIGSDKAGFLHADDVDDGTTKFEKEYGEENSNEADEEKDITKLLKEGETIIVQVTKEPINTKGARLTQHISFPGRFLVGLPNTNFIGISKKIRRYEEKKRLKEVILSYKNDDFGFVVRTQGEKESNKDFKKEIDVLQSRWNSCLELAEEKGNENGCLYKDSNLIESTLREYFSSYVNKVLIDNEMEYTAVKMYVKTIAQEMVNRVYFYRGTKSLFDQYGLEEELDKVFSTSIPLKKGGSLVIEQTEALVAIDVNTGGRVNDKSQSENIVKTNVDAAWEVAKQMRLRDLGGIIVIDFIDMEDEEDMKQVEDEFRKAIRPDSAPVNFSLISELGLMELTRKRVRPNLVMNHSSLCPSCYGNRYIPKKVSILSKIERGIRIVMNKNKRKNISLVLSSKMCERVCRDYAYLLKYWEQSFGTKIELYEDEKMFISNFRVFDAKLKQELTSHKG